MNKVVILIILTLLSFLTSCSCGQDCDAYVFPVEATFYFVNETSSVITNNFSDDFPEIQPFSTEVMKEDRIIERSSRPTVDDYSPIINTRNFFYKTDGAPLLCEFGTSDILNYENRKEVEDLVFEFTFRFKEEKKAEAEECL